MDAPEEQTPFASVTAHTSRISQKYQAILDRSTPFVLYRWLGTGLCLISFFIRILVAQGWYIVAYALGIYLLNLFLAFLQPKFDPSSDALDNDMEDGSIGTLPTKSDEEFKPFIRRLPEFKFWYWATRAILIGFVCSWFEVFNVPVFWPVLVMYWFMLFFLTMRKQIQHMIKYRYVPFSIGKKSYAKNSSCASLVSRPNFFPSLPCDVAIRAHLQLGPSPIQLTFHQAPRLFSQANTCFRLARGFILSFIAAAKRICRSFDTMSSSGPRSDERAVHQDFIARIRFSNALPPPPNPPKLLDIPNTGLASGQYTTPGFASRLAREQPLNIEADAELGMPLDLVGMPGVFDGDERSIQAPSQTPAIHPHDRPLLRPIAALGKPKVAEANVSFLRRTEYISSITPSKRSDPGHARALLAKVKRPVRAPEPAADTPQAIKRKIDRGFERAEQNLKDPKRIKHPTKKNLKLVDARPLIPDLDAFPDSGAYVTIKFLNNPAQKSNKYERRLLTGLFRPIERTQAEEAEYEAALAAHEQDPRRFPKPQNLMNYDFYISQNLAASEGFRRKFDVDDPDRDDDHLYTHQTDTGGCFQYGRLRAYETVQETELHQLTKYDEEIILSYNDDETYPNQKAVYYYPVMQKSTIGPQRRKNIARATYAGEEEEQVVDQLDVTVDEPTEEMRNAMKKYKEYPLGWENELQEDEEGAEEAADQSLHADADGDEAEPVRRSRSVSEERDAEGEDDEE
ncbi:Protein RER1 [Paramyrothecium foliicola]|nr:Protein RER1 [Paramyrothecium foliicola]